MKKITYLLSAFILFATLVKAGEILQQEVTYKTADGTNCKGYVAYMSGLQMQNVILVVPEWWGCNEYARMRANKLAELGYFAFAVDMYGEGKTAKDPKEANELAGTFYGNPKLVLDRLNGAQLKLKEFKSANVQSVAAIGYCFGGAMLLNAAKLGMNLKGVVSFHGNLQGVSAPDVPMKAKILVCHGNSDSFVTAEEVNKFKADMAEHRQPFEFIGYDNATHAFTNPDATVTGKQFNLPIAYNEEADKKSWDDMKLFLNKVFK